jgi:HPt (histidine-containing phosphotransfer) domain-containing protein
MAFGSSDDPSRHTLPLLDNNRMALLAEALGQAKLIELCETARQSIVESIGELRSHWSSGDGAAVAKSAHRLAGVSANFGCIALADLAASIEKECRSGGDGKHRSAELEVLVKASLEALARPI